MKFSFRRYFQKTRKLLIPKEVGEPVRLLPAPQAEIRVDGDNNIYPVQQLAKARAQLLSDVRGSEGYPWTILKATLGILPGGQAIQCVGDELASVWIPDPVPHVQWSAPVRLVTAPELKALGVSLGEAAAEPSSVPQSEGCGGGGAQTVPGTGSEAMSTRQHKAPTPLTVPLLNNSAAADKETRGTTISAPERGHKIEMEPAQDDSFFDAGAAVSSRKRKLEGANDSDTCIMPLPKTAFVTPPTVSVIDRDVVDICCNSSGDNTQSTNTNGTVASTSNCNVKGEGIHTSVTMPDVIDIDGSSDNSDDNTQSTIAENTVTSTVNTRGKREGIICTSVTVSVSPDVIELTDSANDRSHSNTESIFTENTITNKAHVEREGTGKAAAGSHGTASVDSSVKGSDGVRNSTSKGENAHTRNSHGNGEGRSASATVAATSVVTDLEGTSSGSSDVIVITENTHTKAENTITTYGRDARLKNPAPPTDRSIASTLSRAVSELSGCLNGPSSAGISYSVVRQKQQGSSDPLSKTHRMFSEAVLAEEHARYVWMDQQGQVGNAEPRKVAALDMWERKALREMGLVDCLPVTVAHDADGNAVFMNESLEVINGLVFFKLAVLLQGSRYGEGSPARVTLPALMDGQLGGIAFRCDYCAFCTDQDILPHLMKAQHPSGSSVLNFTEKGKEGKARCIVVPSLVKAPAPFNKHVPVCPVCHAVFDDIMDCVSHTYTHGGITGVYQLRLVTRIKTVTIAKTIKCSTCKEVFANVATLLEHWIQINHAQLDGEEMAVIYCCQSSGNCRFRSSDIGQTCQHILNRHIQGGRGGEIKGIAKAVYLGGPTPIRRLMPLFPMSCVDINPAASANDVRAGVQERKDNASPGDSVSVTPTDSRCVNGRDTKTGSTSCSTSFGRSQQRGEDTENKALLSEDSGVNRAANADGVSTDAHKDSVLRQSKPAAGIDTARTDTPEASVPRLSKPSPAGINTANTDTLKVCLPYQSEPAAGIDTARTDTPNASVPYQSKPSAATIDTVSTASVPHQSKPSATTTVAASTDSPKASVLHQSKPSAATIDAASTDSAKASVPHQSKPSAAGIHTVRTDTPKVSVPHQSKSSVADTNAAGGQSVDTDIVLWGTASAGDVSYEQIAAEHERYLAMERQGLICNAEPRVVAGLDMLERKTLRDMGLVDVVRPAVAHDADGQPIPLDNSLEVIHGLAFLKLFAVLRNTSEETTGTRLKTATLMKGSLGDLAYKCDYCTEVFGTAEDLLPHLETARHPTGSTVLRRRESPRKPRCIIAPSSIKHPPSVFQSLVAVCPVCEAVFEEIMDCVAHTHAHGGITGVYQLRRVLSQKDISVTKTMECCVCGAGFPGDAALLEHWRDTQHVQLEREKETIVFFLCRCSSDCHYRSSEPEQVLQHVLREHLEGGQCAKGMVKGVCLGGPSPFKRLMPFFPGHRLDNDEPDWKLRHLDFHSSFVGRSTESSTVVTATLSTASATSLNQPGTSSAVVSQSSSPSGENISSTLLQSDKAPVTNMTSAALSLNKPSCANSSTALLGNKPSRANSSTALLGNKPSRANSSTALLGNKTSVANSSTARMENKPSVVNSSTADLENKLSVANSSTAHVENKTSVANSSTAHVENKPPVANSSTAHLAENKPAGADPSSSTLPRSGFNGSFSPLSTVRAMSADLVAKEHEHYMSLERCGQIRNEEPSMVAALSMWERKALRLLDLVDQAVTVVAFDDACEPVPLDDNKLELHRGLAFLRLDALQRDCAHSTTQTRIKTKALLSNSMFGGISHRCDYCSEMFSSEECLLTHLRDRKHSSGSTVLRWPRKKKTARCIIVPSSARHPPSFFESFVPVCPVCHAAFREIMECVAHTYTHGGITGVYQLRQVCKTEVFVVTEDFQCTRCGAVFCSVAKLQEHWQRTKHIQLVSQQQTFVIYCCHSGNDCYFHSDDFQQAYLHALNQHLRLGQGKEGKSWIKAVYLEQHCPVRRLLPFFPVHCLDVDPSLSSDTSGSQNSQCLNGGQSTPASAAVQYGQHSAR